METYETPLDPPLLTAHRLAQLRETMGSKFNFMRSQIIRTYSANMCAVRSAHALYVIYNDADSKLSLTQQNRGRNH